MYSRSKKNDAHTCLLAQISKLTRYMKKEINPVKCSNKNTYFRLLYAKTIKLFDFTKLLSTFMFITRKKKIFIRKKSSPFIYR